MEARDELKTTKKRHRFNRWYVWTSLFAAAILFGVILLSPKNPVAVITVVDAQGKPILGATVKPYAIWPKRAGGQSGHYGWTEDRYDVPPEAVVTDKKGVAVVPYPTFVVERVETGEITISIKHPEYISDNCDVVVSSSPPSGAPLAVWVKYILNRLRNRVFVTRSAPVVLRQGQTVILEPAETLETTSKLYAQTSSEGGYDCDFWDQSQPGMLVSRKHAPGNHAVRLISLDEENQLMFSDTVDLVIQQGVSNRLSLILEPGKTVRGRLSDNVTRPVVNGRVVVNVVPTGRVLGGRPPGWHAWTSVDEDGSFEMPSLPAGNLEIVALCDGFISVSNPGQQGSSTIRFPQKHVIGADDLDIVIEMEPTARLEVTVYDQNGRPLEGARVSTWPNVCWGGWASTIFCSDLYNTIDLLRQTHEGQGGFSREDPPGFSGISDKTGLAILSNVPVSQTRFTVGHPDYVLPKVQVPGGAPRREASIVLRPGAATEISVNLEPRNKDPLRHY
jgi:hypothetical protein